MIKVELAQWRQTVEDLRLASVNATHPRSRERFQALYLIASGQFNATTCAAHIGRQDETVLRWVHLYNRHGPEALAYRHTGGSAPLFRDSRSSRSWPPWRTPTPPRRACPGTTGR
jgi:hypothetical protein